MSSIDGIRLNLLLFSVGGVHFGMDAEQAAAITGYHGEEAEDLFWFHEEIGFGGATLAYSAPTIVTIRGEDSLSYRVIIDKMEDIAEISSVDIQSFPLLVESLALRKGMWGVTVREGRMVLLIDFTRLLRHKSGTAYI
ncbi:MAG: hypothetical protein PHP95_09615 [Desulfuromonadaceae bacterium]|nr:hypothetical protein [Desulfuromonadaceae bacterium]MDD2848700.1 hypothetical protein [Desulfuromonadaceae bacterium]MDD4130797.1 hypothetical protein [Desulfuromonadaceae bacterium]